MYYVHEETVAVLSLAVVTKMSYLGLFWSNVYCGFLAYLGWHCIEKAALLRGCSVTCGMCAKCMVDKFVGVLVNPSSTSGKECLDKASWAQLLAGLCI